MRDTAWNVVCCFFKQTIGIAVINTLTTLLDDFVGQSTRKKSAWSYAVDKQKTLDPQRAKLYVTFLYLSQTITELTEKHKTIWKFPSFLHQPDNTILGWSIRNFAFNTLTTARFLLILGVGLLPRFNRLLMHFLLMVINSLGTEKP